VAADTAPHSTGIQKPPARIDTTDSDSGGVFAVYDSVDVKIEFFDEAESINTTASSNAIPNNPPVTSAPVLIPSTVYTNTTNITCINSTTTDGDNDDVIFHYKWFNNSMEITGVETNYLTRQVLIRCHRI